jgi:hypothetical protein
VPWTSKHIKWLIDTHENLKTQDGKNVKVFEFQHQNDDGVLSVWAKHFRNHYCLDSQINFLTKGTGLTKTEYLNQIKFPDKSFGFGPGTRAGDFGEILAADYLEYVLNYWVPRTRYIDKAIRNESKKGSDTIGFLFVTEGKISPNDTLAILESKVQYSGRKPKPTLQDAVNHSAKDITRKAESLNAIKQRFIDQGKNTSAVKVARFQNEADNPYQQIFGAVAHWDSTVCDNEIIAATKTENHLFSDQLFLLVIKGKDMMDLVHNLYRKAADEA